MISRFIVLLERYQKNASLIILFRNEIKLLSEEINQLTKPVSNLVFPEKIRVIIWRKISRSRIWKTLVPIFAGFIIASPLPDELGVAIFGAVKYEPRRFLLISYILNFIGILIVTSIGNVLVQISVLVKKLAVEFEVQIL